MRTLLTIFTALLLAGCSSNKPSPQPAATSNQNAPAAAPSPEGATPKASDPELRQAGLSDDTIKIMKEAQGEIWGRSDYTDSYDGKRRVIFSMVAFDSSDQPTSESLKVSCGGPESPDFWISLKEPENDKVKIAIDDSAPLAQKWDESPKHDFLMPAGKESPKLMRQIKGAKTVKFEYTPLAATTPRPLTFRLLNLKELLSNNKLCNP